MIRKLIAGVWPALVFILASMTAVQGQESAGMPEARETAGWGDGCTVVLGPVIVTAERFPVNEKESPRFLTVVSSEQLEETGANNLIDALRRTGGLAYKAFAPLGTSHGGMNSSVSIRGIKDGELVLINGVPVQGAAGHAYDLNTVPIEQIDRVEIMKGAASTLYGADAMSGVINIITRKPRQETALKGSAEFGNESYHNHRVSALLPFLNIGLSYQHLGAQTEISRSFSGKYRYDQDDIDSYAWNLNAELMENLYLNYLGSYYETGFKKHFDGNTRPFERIDQEHQKNFADLRYETPTLGARVFGTHEAMRRKEHADPGKPEDKNENYNFGVGGDFRFELSDWQFSTGTEWVYRGADYNNEHGEHHRNDFATFLQVKKSFLDRLIAVIGARQQFVFGESGTEDYRRFLPSFGFTYKAADALNLFANAGKAFRAPTFNNLYYESPFLVGNPNLKPEEGWTYEAGVKYDNYILRLRLSGFYMTYKDKIEVDRSRAYPLTYINAGSYESKGVEWELGVYPFIHQTRQAWMQKISVYTAGYRADPTAEDLDGREYRAGPKFQAGLGVNYLGEPLVLDLNSQILRSRERGLYSYAVFNFLGKYRLWKGRLTFSVDNILDQEVQVSGDLTADATNRYAYYEVGRLFKGGYEIIF